MGECAVTNHEYDVIVLGTGIAGLSMALAAHEKGLRPLVIEKADKVGGGTTNSYGLIWVGNNHLAQAAGYEDNRDDIISYMRFLAGGEANDENLLAYVDRAPEALKFFERCGIPFRLTRGLPDHYFGVAPGGRAEGRSLEVDLLSGFELGEWQHRVRMSTVQPCYITAEEQINWGGVNRYSSWDQDLVRKRREQDIRGKGLGLVCQFLKALLDRRVPIITGESAQRLVVEDGRVRGVIISTGTVRANCGVVLATGGYESNPELVASFEGLPGWMSQCPTSVTGDGLTLATEVGGAVHLIRNNMGLFLGFGIPLADRKAEPEFHLAGIIELCSPHTMVVNQAGERFADEAYFQGMIPRLRHFDSLTHTYPNLPCFLIFDQQYASSYSFSGFPAGAVIPDWVARDSDVGGLARKLTIEPDRLQQTVERFNEFARVGRDTDFHRGELAWRLAKTDVPLDVNPTLGALSKPPFYGIELHPSALSSAGLLTNASAQVLNQRRRPIPGLYALGNTAAHTEFGAGYQAGYTLASSMTFGYLAVEHMLQAVLVLAPA
jgi:3-oxosteroid 1-dehydrogenase